MARKPISEKTIAENVIKWKTGGINIDGSRIEGQWKGKTRTNSPNRKQVYGDYAKVTTEQSPLGRFPANVILDKEAGEMLDQQSEGKSRFFYCPKASSKERNMGLSNEPAIVDDGRSKPIDNPFLRGKLLRKNTHPTVKPIKLMEYLITLVTPPKGTVLEPFAGSGTTLIAAKNLDFDFIGFELDKQYCDIANERIEEYTNQMNLLDLGGDV